MRYIYLSWEQEEPEIAKRERERTSGWTEDTKLIWEGSLPPSKCSDLLGDYITLLGDEVSLSSTLHNTPPHT